MNALRRTSLHSTIIFNSIKSGLLQIFRSQEEEPFTHWKKWTHESIDVINNDFTSVKSYSTIIIRKLERKITNVSSIKEQITKNRRIKKILFSQIWGQFKFIIIGNLEKNWELPWCFGVFGYIHVFPWTFLGDLFVLACGQEPRAYFCGQKI